MRRYGEELDYNANLTLEEAGLQSGDVSITWGTPTVISRVPAGGAASPRLTPGQMVLGAAVLLGVWWILR